MNFEGQSSFHYISMSTSKLHLDSLRKRKEDDMKSVGKQSYRGNLRLYFTLQSPKSLLVLVVFFVLLFSNMSIAGTFVAFDHEYTRGDGKPVTKT